MTFLVGLTLTSLGMMLLSTWALVCNARTFRDRMEMVARIHTRAVAIINDKSTAANWDEGYALMNAVSYHQHLRTYAMLRDPMRLYPARLWRWLDEKCDRS